MTLTVNGESKSFETDSLTLSGLLENLELPVDHIAVELNRDIIPRVKFGETSVQNGDIIEIVRFVGGGLA